jgi:hypothetical protein
VLESWISIETTLIETAEVEARQAWVEEALAEVTGKRCP